MSILAWIILGGFAGWIASLIMKTNDSMGIFANIFVGIVGAFIGGLIFNFFGATDITGFNLYSLLVAVVGATVLLWLVGMLQKA